MNDIDDFQEQVHAECVRRWPDVTIERETLALVEEIGEVCRCIVKLSEGTRGTAEEWSDEIVVELGQALMVLLVVIRIEGLRASDCFKIAMDKFLAKPEREGMNL